MCVFIEVMRTHAFYLFIGPRDVVQSPLELVLPEYQRGEGGDREKDQGGRVTAKVGRVQVQADD